MEKIEITAAEFAELNNLRTELRQRRVSDKVKDMGCNKSGLLRQRLALRRVDIKAFAPDADLVAYEAIHKLKNPTADSKLKTFVTDNEITAYKALDPDFNKILTSADISTKVAELKVAGKLTSAGDNAGDAESGSDNQDLIG